MVGEAGVNEHIIQRPLRIHGTEALLAWFRDVVNTEKKNHSNKEQQGQQIRCRRTTGLIPCFSGSGCLSVCAVAA